MNDEFNLYYRRNLHFPQNLFDDANLTRQCVLNVTGFHEFMPSYVHNMTIHALPLYMAVVPQSKMY